MKNNATIPVNAKCPLIDSRNGAESRSQRHTLGWRGGRVSQSVPGDPDSRRSWGGMGQPLQDHGKGPGMSFTAYPKPSPHGSSGGVGLPDASEEASPGSPETGKVTDVVTITLDAQDSAAKRPQPPPSRGTDQSGMRDLLPQRFLTLRSQILLI